MSRIRLIDHNVFMAIRRSRERRPSVMDVVDGLLFAFAGLATIWLAYLVVKESIRPGWPLLLLIVFWVLLTYLLLPRLHRIMTQVYVPGYFIGRARTSDGLLGDPVNLALRGHEAQIHMAMARAGWTRADDLSLRTGFRILRSTLSRRSYFHCGRGCGCVDQTIRRLSAVGSDLRLLPCRGGRRLGHHSWHDGDRSRWCA